MRDPARIQRILMELYSLWMKYPDMRLGQLFTNLSYNSSAPVFYLEDEDMEALIEKTIQEGF